MSLVDDGADGGAVANAGYPVSSRCQSFCIGNDHLSVAVTPFSNRLLVFVSAYGKVGHLLDISRVSVPLDPSREVPSELGSGDDEVISVQRLLGAESELVEVAGRYLAEKLMAKSGGRISSVLLGISLKDYGRAALKECAEKISDML